MAKIILATNETTRKEIQLKSERVTIGRRPCNDVVLVDPAISAEHAVIVTVFGDPIIEDLNSKNGTRVNGQLVRKHALQDGAERALQPHEARPSELRNRQSGGDSEPDAVKVKTPTRKGLLTILNGPNSGKSVALTKPLTTIGQRNGQVAVIAASANGYRAARLEGTGSLAVNGYELFDKEHLLKHGDVIEFLDVRFEFSLF
jgi:pSer/pThr/pTyr-binding forkhead associated (FHA) protein